MKMTMKILPAAAVAVLLALTACFRNYNVDESSRLADLAASDTALTQENYSQMIDMLNRGYSYMQERVAKAALERNPSKAVNDVIDFLGDSTLAAVQSHSSVLIAALDSARLSHRNARRFAEVKAKYAVLQASLQVSDSATKNIPDTIGAGEL